MRVRSVVVSVSLCVALCAPVARAQELPCEADDLLARAAGALLLDGDAPASDRLDAAVREAGSDAVRVHALYLPRPDDEAIARWFGSLRKKADAALVCGDAQSEHGRLIIATARGGGLAPLTASGSVVRGSLASGFTRPELVIAAADGQLVRLGVEPSMLQDGVPLALDLARPAKVQLLAHGPSGPRPVAERILPGSGVSAATPRAVPGHATARVDLLGMLHELRLEHGRPELRSNRLLTEVASRHAAEMCRQERLAHELAPGRDPEARLAAAGIRARLVGETVARAPDAGTAFVNLTQSPSHLLTLTEPRFTDAGAGQAVGADGRVCTVLMLAAWPRYVGR